MYVYTHTNAYIHKLIKRMITSIKESSLILWKEMENIGTALVMVFNLETRAVSTSY